MSGKFWKSHHHYFESTLLRITYMLCTTVDADLHRHVPSVSDQWLFQLNLCDFSMGFFMPVLTWIIGKFSILTCGNRSLVDPVWHEVVNIGGSDSGLQFHAVLKAFLKSCSYCNFFNMIFLIYVLLFMLFHITIDMHNLWRRKRSGWGVIVAENVLTNIFQCLS